MVGLKRGTVKLLPYNPKWIQEFEKEKRKLMNILGDLVVDIQHIGSTSILGTVAKPIIDIDVGVRSIEDFPKYVDILKRSGYDYRENAYKTNEHLLFAKGVEENRTHYIHLIKYNGEIWEHDIRFRDFLRSHKKEDLEYVKLKKRLADKFPEDRKNYTMGKEKFIKRILSLL